MRIVLIGAGNVATVLGKKILAVGHEVEQVYSRSIDQAKQLADLLHCGYTSTSSSISSSGDVYIVAISDYALPGVGEWLKLDKKIVVHTAGSVSMQVLKTVSKNYGVLYPLQSLNKNNAGIPVIPFLVDGNTEDDLTLIYDFAKTLSDWVETAPDDKRLKLHMAAVVVSNFTNHLYSLANQFCDREEINFQLLLPLVTEVATRLIVASPQAVQTGPAIRNDQLTIEKHMGLLETHPELREIYLMFTKSIQAFHGVKSGKKE
jgi:predicted short-subunit dehydrogenase-like oxidoreductase (DUF2520 family)